MNWVIASLIMFFSSAFLYLSVRKSSLQKFPTQFNNLAMFSVPLIIYLTIGVSRGISYSISLPNFIIIILASFLFSYLGNVASLKSIELSPNAGYSLVISKSYVVLTTIISLLFLGGELTLRKGIAICLIVLFSGLVIIDPKKTKKVSSNLWLYYTMFAFFAWGFLSLTIKYLSLHGVNTLVMLTYLYVFVTLFIVLEALKLKVNKSIFISGWKYFVSIGVFSALFNYFNFYAVSISPNVGYVNAINASSISLVSILSVLLFKDELSVRKLIGIFGVTGGLLLLLI
ncbi:MAG: EamA family transporter [Microgenomates group bacterium]